MIPQQGDFQNLGKLPQGLPQPRCPPPSVAPKGHSRRLPEGHAARQLAESAPLPRPIRIIQGSDIGLDEVIPRVDFLILHTIITLQTRRQAFLDGLSRPQTIEERFFFVLRKSLDLET